METKINERPRRHAKKQKSKLQTVMEQAHPPRLESAKKRNFLTSNKLTHN